MKTWKKYLTLGVVALLLIGAVYVNIKLNDSGSASNVLSPQGSEESASQGDTLGIEATGDGTTDYFEAFRSDRDSTRAMEIEYLNETIATSASDAETLADAQEAKLVLVNNMEKEFTMESLIKAKGFADAAVMYKQGSVNVVVKAAELAPEQVAQILAIVIDETNESAENIKIIPNA